MKLLIESQYAGSILYFAVLRKASAIVIEQHEHYRKGSYRNRCMVLGANGLLRLSIPLQSGKDQNKPFHNVLISYEEPWQKIHWESLMSAYRRSPYFEYYEHHFAEFYQKNYYTLSEFNHFLFIKINELLKKPLECSFTNKYLERVEFNGLDVRNFIYPNCGHQFGTQEVVFPPYIQVFSDRFDFEPNLSIFDLLFNLGPKAGDYLDSIDVELKF